MKKFLSITALFLLSFSFFAKSIAKNNVSDYKVGDIVLEDGSTVSYKTITDAQKTKAVAVIFYVEEQNSPLKGKLAGKVLGFGLQTAKKAWATDKAAYGHKDLESLKIDVFTNGKEGLDRLNHSHSILTENTLSTNLKEYPAFEYCKNYRANKKKFNKGWFLPSKLEIEQLKENFSEVAMAMYKAGANKTFITTETAKFDPYVEFDDYGFTYLDIYKSIITSSIWTASTFSYEKHLDSHLPNDEESYYLSIYQTGKGNEAFGLYRKGRWQEADVIPVYSFVENDLVENNVFYEKITPKYNVGDVILKNGKVVSKNNWDEKLESQVDCIVFYVGSKSTDVLGAKVLAVNVNVLEAEHGLPFINAENFGDTKIEIDDKSMLGNVKWNKPYNIPFYTFKMKTFDPPEERYAIGETDGSDNWEIICKKYPEKTKGKERAKNFPAINWIKTNLGEEYYMPSLIETIILKESQMTIPNLEKFNYWNVDFILTSTLSNMSNILWSVGSWEGNLLQLSKVLENDENRAAIVGIKRIQ